MGPVSTPPDGAVPIFVDLDGTLVATDTLVEGALIELKRSPWRMIGLSVATLRGRRAWLKRDLAANGSMPDVAVLPYREDVLAFLKDAKAEGRKVILISASDQHIVDRVSTHLGLFDLSVGSDGQVNLKGKAKLEAIQALCQSNGWGSFGYMGDSSVDVPIWGAAEEAYVVGASKGTLRAAEGVSRSVRTFESPTGSMDGLLRALRPHQWVKNALVFVPLLLAREWDDPGKLSAAILAFIAFSATASAIYLVNDLLDIESDRRHPTKRNRPFAAGTLPLGVGPLLSMVLLVVGFTLSIALLPQRFIVLLASYLALTTAYSFWLKRRLLVDAFVLAGLYGVRVLAGGYATETVVTEWLMAFTGFLFLSLAFAKRYTELRRLVDQGRTREGSGRAYKTDDLAILESVGPASGYMAVLVLALYISASPDSLYENPAILWLLCPLALYWITRLWFFARRGVLDDDPVLFAIRDRVSLGVALASVVVVAMAAVGGALPRP